MYHFFIVVCSKDHSNFFNAIFKIVFFIIYIYIYFYASFFKIIEIKFFFAAK